MIGIPYALKETGLIAGLVLIFIVAMLTDKSLRLLIETGKRAGVNSYETLLEVAFGRAGFVFISINMFLMSYGAMVAYLLVLKDTVPTVLGVSEDDEESKRAVLLISSLAIILPLSMQRDMADLSKTSTVSVMFDLCMVGIIAMCSITPVRNTIEEHGGIENVIEDSIVKPTSLFIGLGVLSFAFVCQDSSFIIAGSLDRPTKERWATVTRSSLMTCATLATVLGLVGYLGFQGATEGNILNNFVNIAPDDMLFDIIPRQLAVNVARGLLGATMFCVYPLSSYVARHALIVLMFSGRKAHEGDDHTVLARTDRRVILTLLLYISAVVPAMMWDDTGIVLAITGAVAGSCLSYLGPGFVFLGIYGREFLAKARWNVSTTVQKMMWMYPTGDQQGQIQQLVTVEEEGGVGLAVIELCRLILWWFTLMPLWCFIANTGSTNLEAVEKERLRKRTVTIMERSKQTVTGKTGFETSGRLLKKAASFDDRKLRHYEHAGDTDMTERYPLLKKSLLIPPTPSTSGQTHATMLTPKGSEPMQITSASTSTNSSDSQCSDDDDKDQEHAQEQDSPDSFYFLLAISYILLGAVALLAGLWSIFS